MSRIEVVIPTPDGACPASLHAPDGGGPWPAVIMYPDAVGPGATFRAMADRLAGLGLRHVAARRVLPRGRLGAVRRRHRLRRPGRARAADGPRPEPHARTTWSATPAPSSTSSRSGPRWRGSGSAPPATAWADGSRCTVAGHHPDRIGAAASFHGGRLAHEGDPDSPAADRRPRAGHRLRRRGRERRVVPARAARPARQGLHRGRASRTRSRPTRARTVSPCPTTAPTTAPPTSATGPPWPRCSTRCAEPPASRRTGCRGGG